MGQRQVYPLTPVSPWSPDPWNDAAKEISAATGVPVATILANAILVWYHSPYVSPGIGSGDWQWGVKFQFESESSVEKDLYTIGSAGNIFTTVGGGLAAPEPNFAASLFTNTYQKMSPLVMSSYRGSASMNPGGGTTIFPQWMEPTNPANVLADMINALSELGATTGVYRFYNDPVTVNGVAGRGIWRAKCFSWSPAYVLANVVESGGCALQQAGGRPYVAAPPSFAGWTQMHSLWSL